MSSMTEGQLLALADEKDKAANAITPLIQNGAIEFAERVRLFDYATELRSEVFRLRNEAARLQGQELGFAAASLVRAVEGARTALETMDNITSAIEIMGDLVAVTWYLVDRKWTMLRAAVTELKKDLEGTREPGTRRP